MNDNLVKRILCSILWVTFAVISSKSYALRCQIQQQNGAFQLSSINVPANVKTGTFLSDWIAIYRTPFTGCVSDGGGRATYVDEFIIPISPNLGNIGEGGLNYTIYGTPTPGVGYILEGNLAQLAPRPITGSGTSIGGFGFAKTYPYNFRMRLVATGQAVVNPGILNSFTAFQTKIFECISPYVTDSCNPVGAALSANWGVSSGAVTTRTCTVVNQAVIFPLPSVRDKDMPSVGATAGNSTRNIELNCPAGSHLAMVMTDHTSPANRTSTLTLTADSEASGFGIEVTHDGKPVFFGPDSASVGAQNQFLIGNNLSGAVSIPLTARYIRTQPVSRAGTVKALATFTMSYQ
jgi:type 1 fimbria pilin